VVTPRRSREGQGVLSLACTDGANGSGIRFLCQGASVSTTIASDSELRGQRTHTETKRWSINVRGGWRQLRGRSWDTFQTTWEEQCARLQHRVRRTQEIAGFRSRTVPATDWT
jgi:hypothetical protein